MKKLFTILLLLTFAQAKSQAPNWLWGRTAPSTGWGEGWSVATDASNNVFFTGDYEYSISFGSTNFTSPSYTVFLAKYDSSGNVLWAKSPGGLGGAFCGAVATDNFGNSFVTGRAQYYPVYFDTDSINLTGGRDIFITKYDSGGNELWVRGFDGTGTPSSNAITTDSNGNSYITGYFMSPSINFGTYTLTGSSTTNINMFLVKLDPLGNVLFAKTVSCTGASGGNGVCTDNSGNVYATGYFGNSIAHFGSDSLINSHTVNFFIVKYDNNGNEIWVKGTNGIGIAEGISIASDSYGNTFTTGYFDSLSINFDLVHLTNTTRGNFFIVKYDSLGNAKWAQTTSGSNTSQSWTVDADPSGNSYVSGHIYNNLLPVTFDTITLPPPLVPIDIMFLVKYNPCGRVVFAELLPSGGDDNNSVSVSPSGSIYIGGDFDQSSYVFGNDTVIDALGSETVFIAKSSNKASPPCNIEGLNEVDVKENTLIYPNPVTDKLNVQVNNNEPTEIILYDLSSRKLLQQIFTNTTTINTEQLAKGMYLYTVRNRNGIIKNGKVIKQ